MAFVFFGAKYNILLEHNADAAQDELFCMQNLDVTWRTERKALKNRLMLEL